MDPNAPEIIIIIFIVVVVVSCRVTALHKKRAKRYDRSIPSEVRGTHDTRESVPHALRARREARKHVGNVSRTVSPSRLPIVPVGS